jgi:hypothetical protein
MDHTVADNILATITIIHVQFIIIIYCQFIIMILMNNIVKNCLTERRNAR